MINNLLTEFSKIESEKITPSGNISVYKKFSDSYIRADLSTKELIKVFIHSEHSLFPIFNLKAWYKYLKQKKYKKFLSSSGVLLQWFFLKKEKLPIQADLVYVRHGYIIMIYANLEVPKVVKIAKNKSAQRVLRKEAEKLEYISRFQNEEIFIPKLLDSDFTENSLNYTVEEFFPGKRQTFKNRRRLRHSYENVFKFLVEVYLQHEITLYKVDKKNLKNFKEVIEFFESFKHGSEANRLVLPLIEKKRCLILTFVHNDLNHKNILTGRRKIGIIDWADSGYEYLSQDLRTSSFSTHKVFEEFVIRAKIDQEKIYDFHEQLVLGDYLMLYKLAIRYLSRKEKKEIHYNRIKARLKKIATN